MPSALARVAAAVILCSGPALVLRSRLRRLGPGWKFVHAMADPIFTSGVNSVGATSGRTSASALHRFQNCST